MSIFNRRKAVQPQEDNPSPMTMAQQPEDNPSVYDDAGDLESEEEYDEPEQVAPRPLPRKPSNLEMAGSIAEGIAGAIAGNAAQPQTPFPNRARPRPVPQQPSAPQAPPQPTPLPRPRPPVRRPVPQVQPAPQVPLPQPTQMHDLIPDIVDALKQLDARLSALEARLFRLGA